MVKRYHLNEKFNFTGFIGNSMLPEYYAAADAFCIPSKFETQGIAPIEAMACGKPVIGADYLALKELIINGKNGEKFSPDDHRNCARKIRKVINNTESYKAMSDTAKRVFDREDNREAFRCLLQDFILRELKNYIRGCYLSPYRRGFG